MRTLGTRKFYKPFQNSQNQEENQVLKNSGYVTVKLHSAYYNSKGNFWQSIFGGNDKIALSSTSYFKNNSETIESKIILDKRTVKSNRNHPLALSKFIALKVPCTADGLELKIELTAVKEDNFENGLDLLNDEQFQQPLVLSSVPVGQILAITNVIKKVFSGINNPNILESTYAGIISKDLISNPVERERLTAGHIIVISNNDEDSTFLANMDENLIQVTEEGLNYNGSILEHTNIVYSILFEEFRGVNETSIWFKKYQSALNKLDNLELSTDLAENLRIFNDSKKLWIEGSALLYEDAEYIDKEKRDIKATFLSQIKNKYNSYDQPITNVVIEKAFDDDKSDNFNFLKNNDFDQDNISGLLNETDIMADQYINHLEKLKISIPNNMTVNR